MAKARKTARKAAVSSRKTSKGAKKSAPKASAKGAKSAKSVKSVKSAKSAKKKTSVKKAPRRGVMPKELDFGPLKKDIRAHVEMLKASSSGDRRVQDALSTLQRLATELTENCTPTMIVPLA